MGMRCCRMRAFGPAFAGMPDHTARLADGKRTATTRQGRGNRFSLAMPWVRRAMAVVFPPIIP
jgi:hypothetical protein